MKQFFMTLTLAFGIFAAQAQNMKIRIGQQAPDLVANDPNGKQLKLSVINKGHYVLLNFWASTNGPCRRADLGLVKLYNEYSVKKFKNANKGFTVVSVSLDKNKDAWVKAIQADGLIWSYHMSDLVDWNTGNCVPANTYGVQFLPESFLLDPQGRVLGKYNAPQEADSDIQKYVQY